MNEKRKFIKYFTNVSDETFRLLLEDGFEVKLVRDGFRKLVVIHRK